jgi:hypothetical protein
MAFATNCFIARVIGMQTKQQKEQQDTTLYVLLTQEESNCSTVIEGLNKEKQKYIYTMLLEEFTRLKISLGKKQNLARRKLLVVSFENLVRIKTLFEIHCPHLLN